MFSFFRRNRTAANGALGSIGVDMHNHLLPGIDDGSPDDATSLRLIEGLMSLGYEKFYCTPHVLGEVHPNTPASISAAASQLRAALPAGYTALAGFAAEYMMDYDAEERMLNNDVLTLPGGYVLIEMSYAVESPNIRDMIFQLQTKGYKPILAHPERYPYYYGRFDQYESFLDAGADLQINLLSLGGYYGKPAQKVAEKLIEQGLVNWLGTDMHHDRHLAALQQLAANTKVLRQIEKIKRLKNRELV
ncbi:MAG: histidinol phosphatase [Chitinophagaceae bacterium]|jgi:tyrosine-protein phosphatase YwqE|nr:histidinol phosphatase [Chitinophagaceae bacterium]